MDPSGHAADGFDVCDDYDVDDSDLDDYLAEQAEDGVKHSENPDHIFQGTWEILRDCYKGSAKLYFYNFWDEYRFALVDPYKEVVYIWPAWSGRSSAGPEDQNQSGYGPIPEGEYYIDPDEIDEYHWWDPRDWDWAGERARYAWGNFRVSIHKAANNNTLRGGFFVHGGGKLGSIGCVDVAQSESEVFEVLEEYNESIPLYVATIEGPNYL